MDTRPHASTDALRARCKSCAINALLVTLPQKDKLEGKEQQVSNARNEKLEVARAARKKAVEKKKPIAHLHVQGVMTSNSLWL